MHPQEPYAEELIARFPALQTIRASFMAAYLIMRECYSAGGKLLVAGNGGSASDSEHIAGELMKRFARPRPVPADFAARLMQAEAGRGKLLAATLERGLPAIPLTSHVSLCTAVINDVGGENIFAQQVYGYGRAGDVFLGISTSGNSENILRAAVTAKALDMKVIGLTGATGGKLAALCDVTVRVPETETCKIQEYHLPVYHCWCQMLEDCFFGDQAEQR